MIRQQWSLNALAAFVTITKMSLFHVQLVDYNCIALTCRWLPFAYWEVDPAYPIVFSHLCLQARWLLHIDVNVLQLQDNAGDFFVQLLQPGHKLRYLLPEPRDIGYNVRCLPKYPWIYRQDQALLQHSGASWTCKQAAAYKLKLNSNELCL